MGGGKYGGKGGDGYGGGGKYGGSSYGNLVCPMEGLKSTPVINFRRYSRTMSHRNWE